MNEAINPIQRYSTSTLLEYDIALQYYHIHFQSSLLTA